MNKAILILVFISLFCTRVVAQCNCLSAEPINSGLIACYPFNGNANDQTANGNHGVPTNVVLTADRFGNPNSAYFFNGNNSIIKVPPHSSLQPSNTLSISVWVRTEPKSVTPPRWSFIVTYRNDNFSAPYNSYNLSTHPFSQYQNKWTFMLASTSNSLDNELVGKKVKQDYVWEHIVATYDGSTMKIYTNGNLDTTRTISIPSIKYSNYGLNIGNHDAGPSTCILGAMDDLRLYNRAITACEVKYLYNNCSGTPTGDLISDEKVETCSGKGLQIGASYNGMSYSWTPASFLDDPNSKTPIATVNESTYFYVTATDGFCYYKDSILVEVKNPTITVNRIASICPGDSVQLQASGAQSYQWANNNTLSNTAIANPYAKPLVTTVYYLTATVNGCLVKDSVTVTITNNLTAFAGNDTSICVGKSVQLMGTGGSMFVWSPNLEINDTTIPNPIISPTQSRWYKLNTTSGMCQSSDSLFVTVNAIPTLVINDTVLCGLQNTFTPTMLTSGATDFLWQPNTYLSADNLQYPQISPLASINYIVTASVNPSGCSAKDTMHVLVGNPKADFSTTPTTVMIPESVLLNNLSDANIPTNLWYVDDVYLSNQRNTQLNVDQAKQYSIKLVVTDSLGCQDSLSKIIEGKLNKTLFIPNVFTPNGDFNNDVFSVQFDASLFLTFNGTIWNRWGQDIADFDGIKGTWWKGDFEGKPCPDGVYFYIINTTDFNNKSKTYSGTLTLIR